MKLSVSAFRAQASAQRKILSSYQNQLNYGACTSFPALGGFQLEEKPQMMVDNTGINSATASKHDEQPQNSDNSVTSQEEVEDSKMVDKEDKKDKESAEGAGTQGKREESEKSPGRTRTKSNQRWMKLRTTVQLSGAISSTNQKSKPPLKREDSFLKRFSTRQIPETQETVDTGDETETMNGSQTQNEVNRRRRKRRKELAKTVVNPDENFYFYWLMTVTVCVLYNLWTLIVRQSFPELQEVASGFWYSGDGFTDVVFVCDIVVQFRTGYLEQGLMVYNSKKLASHYLKSRAFILDILSLLPLDFLQLNLGVNPILRFPRFLKIYRVYNYYYIVESRTVYPNLWRVVNLIHILLILAHWFGCFYYLLSEAEGFQGDWVYPYRAGDYATLTRKYLGSLYWSTLTLTTIGDLPTPETNAESLGSSKAMTSSGNSQSVPRRGHKSRLLQFNSNSGYLFTIVSYLIGVFIFATIVGQVGNVITNRNANRLEFERLLDGAKTYMRHHKVPGGMKRRVLRWYDYSWSRGRIQGGGDINTALGLLPDKLKTELALHVNLSVLKKVTIFQECQPEFLHDLVLKMKAYIFTPGDLICRKGEVAREMFIIADGILDVISENGRVLTTMKAGDFFGEIGILNLDGLNKRTADVRSVGYSELFSLSREDVLTAMKDYPEAQEILQSLGRKRLMEAKNASKIHKAQAKQARDHDSSGDSDTAGKRIVEKLRSDVKGLKNALRRSRRGTRTKETQDGPANNQGKFPGKKQSILRRMSHVQSSDEYETEVAQSPIGAGLPLLQRLKLLKEKQEKEREEKDNKFFSHGFNQKEDKAETEAETPAFPFTQKIKLLKQKEDKEMTVSGSSTVSSTVRTQVTGVKFDKTISKSKTLKSPSHSEQKTVAGKQKEEPWQTISKKESAEEVARVSLKEKLKLVHGAQAREKTLPLKIDQDPEGVRNLKFGSEILSETSNDVPVACKAETSVPKSLGTKFEVPKSKDAWKLLKKSSLTSLKSDRRTKNDERIVRKVSKKGTYLSKSDTVLEKQKTFERDEEKRSRSISPSDNSKGSKKSLKQTVEHLMKERRRTKSLGQPPRTEAEGHDVNFWEYSKESNEKEIREKGQDMKKYDSISDLSPEYSGLPFVKKLKILNERQKLAELEKELLVRSSSLDVPERPATKRESLLVRSQSEASTMEITKAEDVGLRTELEARVASRWLDAATSTFGNDGAKTKPEQSMEFRNVSITGKNHSCRLYSDGSVASPENNETLERRHLKSILKKLSAEDSISDEELIARKAKFASSSSKKSDNAELKKLMRAPTIEGYAARHKKLTKSVTFDSDTLPSPPEHGSPAHTLEETKGKGFSPMSPTAILTLQLSNLSMIPIVSPKKNEDREKIEANKFGYQEKMETEMENSILPEVIENIQEKTETSGKVLGEAKEIPLFHLADKLVEENFRMLSVTENQNDEQMEKIKGDVQLTVRGLLEEVQTKFQSQFFNMQVEIRKRDDLINQLRNKIQRLESKDVVNEENSSRRGSFEGPLGSSGTDPEMSDVPFMRGDSFETILGVNSPTERSSIFFESPRASPVFRKKENITGTMSISSSRQKRDCRSEEIDLPLDYLGNVIPYENRKNYLETEDDFFDTRDEIRLLSNGNPSKRHLKRPLDFSSDSEGMELTEVMRSSRVEDFKQKRNQEIKLKRNFSVDESEFYNKIKFQRKPNSNTKSNHQRKKFENRTDGRFVGRASDFQRSFSCSYENRDFIALDIDDSGNSSDIENPHNKDWELQMLAEELAKKECALDSDWSRESESETEDVRKLQEEVNTLKQMVCQSDLTRLSTSELDMLEIIIDAKDQKITQIAKSNSFEDEGNKSLNNQIRTFQSSNKSRKYEQRKRPSLKQKIGQALSFDFHDIESRKMKSPESSKNKFSLRKQKTESSHPEPGNLYSLWHTSSFLRNRVLEDCKDLSGQDCIQSRSSLPILISGSFQLEKSSDVRTSLPTLSGSEFRSNFVERMMTSSVSFSDDHQESDFKQSCDSVFEETAAGLLEIRNLSHPSTSGLMRLNDGHSSLNSFIKSVGQKMKQVMAGDVPSVKNQVPTISKLCDEQSNSKDSDAPNQEDLRQEEEEPQDVDDEILFDCNPKTDPPDL